MAQVEYLKYFGSIIADGLYCLLELISSFAGLWFRGLVLDHDMGMLWLWLGKGISWQLEEMMVSHFIKFNLD